MPKMLGRLCRHGSWTRHWRSTITVLIELHSCDFVAQLGVSDVGSPSKGGIILLTLQQERCVVARKRKPNAKEAALAESRTLNPRPEAVHDEQFASSEFFDARDLVQVKYEMVRRGGGDGAPGTPTAAPLR